VTKKKPSKKKASKPAKPKIRILAQVELTPAVVEILKSSEAKLYLTGIDRANGKLQAMIRREEVLAQHPGHARR
jgi:hypothetical protein